MTIPFRNQDGSLLLEIVISIPIGILIALVGLELLFVTSKTEKRFDDRGHYSDVPRSLVAARKHLNQNIYLPYAGAVGEMQFASPGLLWTTGEQMQLNWRMFSGHDTRLISIATSNDARLENRFALTFQLQPSGRNKEKMSFSLWSRPVGSVVRKR